MANKKIKGTRLLKRARRTQDQVQNILDWVHHILDGEEGQITLRHLFYRLVGHRVIAKTEKDYKALGKHLSKWRRSGAVEWGAFADNTRWHIRTETFSSMTDAMENMVSSYRRDLWQSQAVYVECWCEKDAVASILARAAEPFGVPIFVARGFASLSSLYAAAETFRKSAQAGKRPIIYHFGDYDPSGVAAGQAMLKTFKEDFKVEVEFHRAAVNTDQIKRLNLPTRPVKTSDSRAANWTGGECVELDTMPPTEIRALVESCITRHIDEHAWEQEKNIEILQRGTLQTFRERFNGNW